MASRGNPVGEDSEGPEVEKKKGNKSHGSWGKLVPGLRRTQLSMKTKLILIIVILAGLIILACGAGISRLGRTDMTPRATKIAERYLNQLTSLSRDTADRIAHETMQRIDLSPYLTDVEKEMGFGLVVKEELHGQVRYALAGRQAQWEISKVSLIQGYIYRVTARTSIQVNAQISASTGDFDREWMLHIELELETEADQGKVNAWIVGDNTHLEQ